MFNVTGGELVIIFLVALVVLGPERLPEAARTVGRVIAQLREVSHGFQTELRSAMDEVGEPLQNIVRPHLTAIEGLKPDTTDKPKSAEMAPAPGFVEPEPDPGWSTPPRPDLPTAPSPYLAPVTDAAPAGAPPADAAPAHDGATPSGPVAPELAAGEPGSAS